MQAKVPGRKAASFSMSRPVCRVCEKSSVSRRRASLVARMSLLTSGSVPVPGWVNRSPQNKVCVASSNR